MSGYLQGKGVGNGWAIGPAVIQQASTQVITQHRIDASAVDAEQARLRAAIQTVAADLSVLKRKLKTLPSRDPYLIVEAHETMLSDRSFQNEGFERIKRQRINAEWAVYQAVGEVEKVFAAIENPYIRTRLDDILNLRDLVIEALAPRENSVALVTELHDAIVVARELSPHLMLELIRAGAAGVALECGNVSGHAAIIAKSMGIPLVVSTENILERVSNGTIVALECTTGAVHINPDQITCDKIVESERMRADQWEAAREPSVTKDGLQLTIEANLDIPEEYPADFAECIDGIGLVRTEVAFMEAEPPTEDELYEQYVAFLALKPAQIVVFRALDIGGDKIAGFVPEDQRDLSPLGLRGVRFLFDQEEIMQRQLRALVRAAKGNTLYIMVPMVIDVREVRRYRQEIGRAMESTGCRPNLKVGAMIETPSAALMLPSLRKDVDFFSVGTNDLVQYTLCVDRTNFRVQGLYDPLHPAILRTLKRIRREAKDVPVTICGEMAADPRIVPVLIGMGYRHFSMPVPSIPAIKATVRAVKMKECKSLAKGCDAAGSSAEINALVDVFARSIDLRLLQKSAK